MYQHRIPPRKKPKNDGGYFEILAQSVFQAGFSWEVVRRKWPNFCRAFFDFKLDKVAAMTPRDVTRLMRDPGIIRNSAKILAIIENARIFQEIQKERGSFAAFLKSIRRLPYTERRLILAKKFRWIGPTGAYYFFWCVGESVPEWEERNE